MFFTAISTPHSGLNSGAIKPFLKSLLRLHLQIIPRAAQGRVLSSRQDHARQTRTSKVPNLHASVLGANSSAEQTATANEFVYTCVI